MCPDWALNQLPFGEWGNAQPTEPHFLELYTFIFKTTVATSPGEHLEVCAECMACNAPVIR